MALDLTDLQAEIARNTDVDASAIALINGIAAKIEAAVAAAEAGNTVALSDLATALRGSSDSLAAAVVAGTDGDEDDDDGEDEPPADDPTGGTTARRR